MTYLPVTLFLGDLAIICGDVVLGLLLRAHLPIFDSHSDISSSLVIAGPLLIGGWTTLLVACGAYRTTLLGAGTEEYARIARASLLAASTVGIGSYLTKFALSRGFFALVFLIGPVALLAWHIVARKALHRAQRHGRLRHRVLVAGTATQIDDLTFALSKASWTGYAVVGCLTPEHDPRPETERGVPVLGHIDDATAVALEHGVDSIVLGAGALSATDTRSLAWSLENQDIEVLLAPGLREVSGERVRIKPIGGLALVQLDSPRSLDATRWGKRLFDVVLSGLMIVAFAPLLAYAALRVKAFDGGPVLFRQTRIGRDGQAFTCLKFRTMTQNADALLPTLRAAQGSTALLFKMKDDPRITAPGRWLRKFSVDELPQLFNVFAGSMSLVGPRPQVAAEVELYDAAMSRRLRVRPGMSGLWQVSGRSDLPAEEAIRLDLYYVDNWSMMQDLGILGRTFGAVFAGHGAY